MFQFIKKIPCFNIFKHVDVITSFKFIIHCYLDSICVLFYTYLIHVFIIMPYYNSNYYVQKYNKNINFKKIIIKALFFCGFIQTVFHYKIKNEIEIYKILEKI